jgi:hypothetical protein
MLFVYLPKLVIGSVVTNGSTPLGGVEGTGTPWNTLEGSSPQGLQGSEGL